MTIGSKLADDRLLEFLRELVAMETTPGREEPIVQLIAKHMSDLGFAEAKVDAAGNAVGRFGSGRPVVLTDCHIDTIPIHSQGQWQHGPFAADVEGGRLYGLGVCDMKASAAAVIYGVARLFNSNKAPSGTVYVVSSIAEEMMEGAALEDTFDRCRPDVCLIGEPTNLRLAFGQRGRAKIEVDVIGTASHAGHPEVGINAVELMAEFVSAIARMHHPEHRALGPRTATCIDIHSEPYPSVSMVPEACRARFDCRFGPDDTKETLLRMLSEGASVWTDVRRPRRFDARMYLAEFETFNGRRYSVPEYAPAWLTDPESPLVRACVSALADAGLPANTSTYGFCTNGSLTAGLRGVTTLGYGVGREEVAHTVDEFIDIENLYKGAAGYAAVVGAMLQAGTGSAP